ncbi:alpha/beta hydrolase [Streptomyces sp. NPDC006430]|uniref:alpha/beta fold hydrolase n=1 Tax=Streptomyces sp. NPDC006430 TaxID=3154299 RepID=UPI0033AF7538
MPATERADGTRIHYETHGSGFPVLLIAPDGASSRTESWESNFYDPLREFAGRFQVIAVDQRHTGGSGGPLAPFSYAEAAADQLAVLDELGVEAAHVVAVGSGSALALRLAYEAPGRVASLVVQAPVGRDTTNTLGTFFGPFDEAMRLARAEGLEGVIESAAREGLFGRNPGAGPFAQRLHDDPAFRDEVRALRRERYVAALVRYRDGVWPDGTPYFSVPQDWPPTCTTPLLVLPGNDARHPEGVAKRLAGEAPRAQLLDPGFNAPENRVRTVETITRFLTDHTPSTEGR